VSDGDAPGDVAALAAYATALADAVERSVGPWLRAVALDRCASHGVTVDPGGRERLEAVALVAAEVAAAEVRSLLSTDVDQQLTTPLEVLRRATRPVSGLLDEWGVPPTPRDEFDQRAFPDDRHALVPASFADIDESLVEPALVWGAAKAHVHLRRRRADGQR
jgi:hypothetical protein